MKLRNHVDSRHTNSKAFQTLQELCDNIHYLNLECCKCARMRFYCTNGLVIYSAIVHLHTLDGTLLTLEDCDEKMIHMDFTKNLRLVATLTQEPCSVMCYDLPFLCSCFVLFDYSCDMEYEFQGLQQQKSK